MKKQIAPSVFMNQYEVNNRLKINADDFEMVQYYLLDSSLKTRADIHAFDDYVLVQAVSRDDWSMVKFLLSSPKLKNHANINCAKGSIFRNLCGRENNIEIIEYFLTSKDLNVKLDPYTDGERLVEAAAQHNRLDIVKLLFEYKLYQPSKELNFTLNYWFLKNENWEAIIWLWEDENAKIHCGFESINLWSRDYFPLSNTMTQNMCMYILNHYPMHESKMTKLFKKTGNLFGLKIIESFKFKNNLEQNLKVPELKIKTNKI